MYRSKPISILLPLLALSLLVIGCRRRVGRAGASGPRLLAYDGRQRTYRVLEPPAPAPGTQLPLVLLLHGGGGSGGQVCERTGGVARAALAAGALVVCPDGIDGHWNDGRAVTMDQAHAQNADDVGFLLELFDWLAGTYPVDRQSFYVSGNSNGGMMTLRMACESSGRIAGAAAVIANLPADLDCQPSAPVPILLMNGTDDPLMPWSGGDVGFLGGSRGEVLSTAETAAFWARANGCHPDPIVQTLPDVDPADGTRIQLGRFPGCDPDGQVEVYEVDGGGHTMPGGAQYLPTVLVGPVSHDLDGGQAIWDFFEAAR
jgi:polyhydroxybutyrate depolymerase